LRCKCATSSPRYIHCSSISVPPSSALRLPHPLGEARLAYPDVAASINSTTSSSRLHCSPLSSSGALQKSGFIAAVSDLQLEIANRSEDSCGTQVEGPWCTGRPRYTSGVCSSRRLPSSYTLSSSLDGSLEKLIEGEASACLFVSALFRKFSPLSRPALCILTFCSNSRAEPALSGTSI
jgi:hypothetical protein